MSDMAAVAFNLSLNNKRPAKGKAFEGAAAQGDALEGRKKVVVGGNDERLSPFLQKLKLVVLHVPENIAGWGKNGRQFMVKNKFEFEGFLKDYFKGSLDTFVRQLHFYGFKKVLVTDEGWSFEHPYFVRDRPDHIYRIKRNCHKASLAAAKPQKQPHGTETEILRSKVAELEVVISDLRSQLDTCMSVLDEYGMLESTQPSRKRKRSLVADEIDHESKADELSTADTYDTTDMQGELYDYDAQGADPGNVADVEDEAVEEVKSEGAAAAAEQQELQEVQRQEEEFVEDPFSWPICAEGIEPLDMDVAFASPLEGSEELADFFASALRYENEAERKDDASKSDTSSDEAKAAAEAVVASETKLDPISVRKVLAFVKKALRSDSSVKKSQCFPQIQNAILNYRSIPLPTQPVGAS